MFTVKDMKGQQIFLRDKLSYEAAVDDMGLLGQVEGLAISFPNEEQVQVQPLGKGGTPVILKGAEVVVTYSLVQKIAALSNNDDLQDLLQNAELRYNRAVDSEKKTKRGGGRGKKPAKPNPFGGDSAPKPAAKKASKPAASPFDGPRPERQTKMPWEKEEGL